MQTSSLQYGNPTAEMMRWIAQNSFLDQLFSPFSKEKVPGNDSEIVKTELGQIKELLQILAKDGDLLARYKLYDRSLVQYVRGFTFGDDEDTTSMYKELVDDVFQDVSPLVYKLKMHFQRPRPFQLAAIHKMDIFPYAGYSNHSPAYPCLHSTVSLVLSHVVGNRIPSTYQYFKDFATDVYHGRLYMGMCLAGDANAGRKLAEQIIQIPEFKIKYRL